MRRATLAVLAAVLAGLCEAQFPQYGSQGNPNNPQYGGQNNNNNNNNQQYGEQFRVVCEWSRLDYAWPDDSRLAQALRDDYVPENNLLSGVRAWRDLLFLSVPRWKGGVPATLATLPAASSGGPRLQPFPSWGMQRVGNCSALQNVRGLEVDTDGRLWVADSGRVDVLGGDGQRLCSPKLVIFDVSSLSGGGYDGRPPQQQQPQGAYNYGYSSYDRQGQQSSQQHQGNFSARVLLSFTFPEGVVAPDSVLMDLVVDGTGGGYAYISDASPSDPGIIVFSRNENRAWKARDQSMRADPLVRSVQMAGQYLSLRFGNVDGLALSPATPNPQEERTLYFSPLASYNMYAVATPALKEASGRGDVAHAVRNLGRKASISDGMTADNRGNLYYGLLTEFEIARWDTREPFPGNQHNISKDVNHLQWPASFGFDDRGSLYVVTNKFHNFLMSKVSTDEPNYRIIRASFNNAKSYLYPAEYVGGRTDYNNQNNPGYNRNGQTPGYNNQNNPNYSSNNPNYNPNYNQNNPNNPSYNPNNPSYNNQNNPNYNNPSYDPNNPNYNQNNPNYNQNNPNDPYGRTSTMWPTTYYDQGHSSQQGGGAATLCLAWATLLTCVAATLLSGSS
ncbi:protein yellow-like [Bacillus rossius redtenbacheri]|uniref:protein yellow-like n=1 Tax=Bacillus rossius redtenbacheri TaxID=93214 RepID=UPI002FDE1D0B